MEGPIKIALCTGYEFCYIPLLTAIEEIHPYILSEPQIADLIVVDEKTRDISNANPSSLTIRVNGESCMYNYTGCDFEIGSHLQPHVAYSNKAWLPYIPQINYSKICTPLQSIPRKKAWERKDIVCIVSHRAPWRTQFINNLDSALTRYKITIDYRGTFGKNAQPYPGKWCNSPQLLKEYKCTLALENKIQPGYITEKIPNALMARTVPITCYPHNCSMYPFPDTDDWLIRADRNPNFDALALRIKLLLTDREAYLAKWDANPLLHSTFYENYRDILSGVRLLAIAIVDRLGEVKK